MLDTRHWARSSLYTASITKNDLKGKAFSNEDTETQVGQLAEVT